MNRSDFWAGGLFGIISRTTILNVGLTNVSISAVMDERYNRASLLVD